MGVNAVEYYGEVLIDLSEDTVTEETLPQGVTAHDANGDPIKGKMPIVNSVNGQSGSVTLGPNEVGAEPANAVSIHNTNTLAHNDIRIALQELAAIVTDILDSEDVNLNELHEIVAYIKSNKTLIDEITTNKVNVSDIIDNLVTSLANKPLSAAQGVALKDLIDGLANNKLDASALTNAINTALAQAKASGEFDGPQGPAGPQGPKGDDGGLSEEQIELLGKLSEWYDESHYVKLTGSFTPASTYHYVEIGGSTSVKFTWKFSKTPTNLTVFSVVQSTPSIEGTKEMTISQIGSSAAKEETRTYSIKGVYKDPNGIKDDEVASKTWYFYFRDKIYYGLAKMPSKTASGELNINGTFVTGLSGGYDTTDGNGDFATHFEMTNGFNFNDDSADKYIWYCYPTRFKDSKGVARDPVFSLGGFAGGFEKVVEGKEIMINSYHTEPYTVWRSTLPGNGNMKVVVE